MKFKQLSGGPGERTFIVVLDIGEEAFGCLTDFAAEQGVQAASVTALGAFGGATVGWFDPGEKTYRKIPVSDQCEVLSLIGDIAEGDDGRPSLHAHVVLGLSDGATRGGHLLEAFVRPTLEVTVVETPAHLRRKKHADLGVALIDLT